MAFSLFSVKMPYYEEKYNLFYKKAIAERKIIGGIKRPDLYNKKTKNQKLQCFMPLNV